MSYFCWIQVRKSYWQNSRQYILNKSASNRSIPLAVFAVFISVWFKQYLLPSFIHIIYTYPYNIRIRKQVQRIINILSFHFVFFSSNTGRLGTKECKYFRRVIYSPMPLVALIGSDNSTGSLTPHLFSA